MSAHIPVRIPDRWAEIDAEDDRIAADYASGEWDRRRALQCERISAMLAELPERQVDEAAARERAVAADAAVARLAWPLLTDTELVAHGRQQARFNREYGRR